VRNRGERRDSGCIKRGRRGKKEMRDKRSKGRW